MSSMQTKIDEMENKMQEIEDPVRSRVLETAKNFKTSWVDLGQVLYSVYKDKLFKSWGFSKFEFYTSKEIGIRKETAMKLLRSYLFLEKEEPNYLKKEVVEESETSKVPSYEAVNLLRLAKNNKNLDKEDYADLKKKVLDDAKDVKDVKKDLTAMIRCREELDPEEARQQKRIAILKRLVGSLKSVQKEIEISKLLPETISKDIESLIDRIESEAD